MQAEIMFENGINGYHVTIKKNPFLGVLLGYVDLPKDHKFYGLCYDKIDVDVHGGLTYSQQKGEFWRIGFDCGHSGDFIPMFSDLADEKNFKDLDFVKSELKNLVEQL